MGANGFLAEAATHKSAIQRLLRQADSILTDKNLPAQAKAEVRKLRDQLRKRWSELSDSGAEAKTAAATESLVVNAETLETLREAVEADGTMDPEAADIVMAFAEDLREALNASDSFSSRRMLVHRALERLYRTSDVYLREMFEADAIVQRAGDLFRHPYTISGTPPAATVEQGVPVEVSYNDLTAPVSATSAVSEAKRGLVGGGITALSAPEAGRSGAEEAPEAAEVANGLEEGESASPAIEEGLTALVESGDWLTEEGEPLTEAAFSSSGTALLKIIKPGWGTSGYYPAEVIKRDGPQVFKRGLQAFWDHAPRGTEVTQPERSLRDLAGVLTEDAAWQDNGPEGPGLYAPVKVFDAFKKPLRELASHIGASIQAFGETKRGKAEGRVGKVVESINAAQSVDFVTRAGAGGKIVQLFESAAPAGEAGLSHIMEVVEMGDTKEGAALTEALNTVNSELARLKAGNLRRDAREFVSARLAETRLPVAARTRLLERLSAEPPVEDGALDVEKLSEALKVAVKGELDYLSEATGGAFGITGLGLSEAAPPDGGKPEADTALTESFTTAFGLSDKEAQRAVAGR